MNYMMELVLCGSDVSHTKMFLSWRQAQELRAQLSGAVQGSVLKMRLSWDCGGFEQFTSEEFTLLLHTFVKFKKSVSELNTSTDAKKIWRNELKDWST